MTNQGNQKKVSREALTASDREALDQMLGQLRKLYSDRLDRVILYGHKSRERGGSDLDVLVVIRGVSNRFVEMSRIHRITGPFKVSEDILITAIPVDSEFLETQMETSFFTTILEEGIALT